MDKEALRHLSEDPSMIFYVAKYWPGLAAVGGLLLGGYSFLASNGYIDGPVHRTEMTVFKAHVEEHEKLDAAQRSEVKETLQEVRGDMKLLLQEQIKQGRAIERIEARGQSTPITKP